MELVEKTQTDGKKCRSCGEVKSLSEYHKGSYSDGLDNRCKSCKIELNRNTRYIKTYGITIDDYNKIFKEQEGNCGICNKHQVEFKKRFAVDHDHDTGEVRGLLCFDCNIGIGKLGDNIEGLEQALRYLNGDTRRNSDRR